MKKILLLFIVFAGIGYGDMFTPRNSCSEPIIPYDDDYSSSFSMEIEYYEQCINNFVEEQKEAADSHIEAAEDAIDEYNDFITEVQIRF